MGTIFLPISLDGRLYDFKFHVVRAKDLGTIETGILGNNILQATRADLKQSTQTLFFTTLDCEIPIIQCQQVQALQISEKAEILEPTRSDLILSKLRLIHVETEPKEKLVSLINQFQDNFQIPNDYLPMLKSLFNHEIHTISEKPIFVKNY